MHNFARVSQIVSNNILETQIYLKKGLLNKVEAELDIEEAIDIPYDTYNFSKEDIINSVFESDEYEK